MEHYFLIGWSIVNSTGNFVLFPRDDLPKDVNDSIIRIKNISNHSDRLVYEVANSEFTVDDVVISSKIASDINKLRIITSSSYSKSTCKNYKPMPKFIEDSIYIFDTLVLQLFCNNIGKIIMYKDKRIIVDDMLCLYQKYSK